MTKMLLIIIDGLGDRPIEEFSGKTPLEAARTPNLNALASNSLCGLMYSVGCGLKPSSDIAHISIFGDDYQKCYTGRGPIELCGLGIKMNDDDIAFRGNFSVISKDGIITDRRSGRHTPPKRILDEIRTVYIQGNEFVLHHIAEHRFALQVIGHSLSSNVSDTDPHAEGLFPIPIIATDNNKLSEATASLVKEYISVINTILTRYYNHGSSNTNSILLRSAGKRPHYHNINSHFGLESSCCITNNALYNGIGALFGMEVLLPYRYSDVDEYYEKIPALIATAIEKHEFVFLHMQEPDLFGEDGNYIGKRDSISKIDEVFECILRIKEKHKLSIVVTADHATPCSLKSHSGDAVPIMLSGNSVLTDNVQEFNERTCMNGGLGYIYGKDVMPLLINLAGKARLIGG